MFANTGAMWKVTETVTAAELTVNSVTVKAKHWSMFISGCCGSADVPSKCLVAKILSTVQCPSGGKCGSISPRSEGEVLIMSRISRVSGH
jgi:hypothetical protein